ncbi:cytochrome P450 [Streptomyces sp. RB6PN25]|uniref:Cytochrome P450 n=1 Tax=Streptomyces humicola TaxID=2953240 RepID=A0ABT1Q0S3_9ACTN|nr:cytochrome P450 [Streptomyces humicola]MCQ4083509.1 cytochrome P450 [Streptomyces humicola]
MTGIDGHPTARRAPFDPPPELTACLEDEPIRRMRYPDGHVGWLVTSHELARSVLADRRFSARSEFKRPPVARPSIEPFYGAPALPGWMVDMDAPEHTRLRRLLTGRFTLRRMRELRPRIEAVVEDLLDAMERRAGPADLVECFSLPVPSVMICELLGVPYAERAAFQHYTEVLFSLSSGAEDAAGAMDELYVLLRRLAKGDAAATADGLLAALAADGTDPEEIAGIGTLLLTAGHETTSSMLSLSVFALLTHPEQLARLVANPGEVDNAVEELLRYLTVFHFGVPRTPLEDVELAGRLLKAGESVTVSLPAANRDPRVFDDPGRLDLGRRTSSHLAFGYGVHQCLGQNLARVEMGVALPALLRRFPALSLAVPAEQVPLALDMGVYGVHRLPVMW